LRDQKRRTGQKEKTSKCSIHHLGETVLERIESEKNDEEEVWGLKPESKNGSNVSVYLGANSMKWTEM